MFSLKLKRKTYKKDVTIPEHRYKRAGIEDFTFHDLRHTCNTNLRLAGVSESVIMDLMGHQTQVLLNHHNTVDAAKEYFLSSWGHG